MNLDENPEFLYHGQISPDDEQPLEDKSVEYELINMGLFGSRIRSSQSVMATDTNFLREHKKNLEILGQTYDQEIPHPFDRETAETLWMRMSAYSKDRIQPIYETLAPDAEEELLTIVTAI